MTRKKTEISSDFFTLTDVLRRARRDTRWIELVDRNRKPLDRIADIVTLGTCWDNAAMYEGYHVLRLHYRGEARDEEAIKPDLQRIAAALRAVFNPLEPAMFHSDHNIPGVYKGPGKLRNLQVWIRLEVSFLPKDCQVHIESHNYRQNMTHRNVSVSCSRR
jgi:hypothetical protein